ncbi:hypothetical protein BDV23DRAFT_180262 [Aspergillus alliaceus]|uniref:Uncharacterized protein n=1 Tax=Petromyces alliaceus TaxID=209559 RepID=A0A5N7CK17_PETAA|nr:hypothetical protein BDV23DRAFT_180262 [Aspergillus alliaceus]
MTLNRSIEHTCGESKPPVNEYSYSLKSQSFTFDEFDNLEKVVSGFQNSTENTASYSFAKHDLIQLTHILNTPAGFPVGVKLKYNDNGSLTRDKKGRKLRYDSLNRLSELQGPDCRVLCQYRYNTTGKLVCQRIPGQPDTHLFYQGDSIVAIDKRRIV